MIILERFEEGMAVLEADGETVTVPREELPENVCEGDILRTTEDGWCIDRNSTNVRRAAMRAKMRRLIKRKND